VYSIQFRVAAYLDDLYFRVSLIEHYPEVIYNDMRWKENLARGENKYREKQKLHFLPADQGKNTCDERVVYYLPKIRSSSVVPGFFSKSNSCPLPHIRLNQFNTGFHCGQTHAGLSILSILTKAVHGSASMVYS